MRRLGSILAVALAVVLATASSAQSPTDARGPLAFEVASVRPSAPGGRGGGIARPVKGLVRARGATVRQLVQYAYDIEPLLRRDPEPEGGPDWIDRDRFDIEARGPADLSFPDSRLRMRSLLAERFTLRVHTEARDLPVYFLMLSRDDRRLGRGLQPSQVDCSAYSAALAATGRGAVAKEVGPQCGLSSIFTALEEQLGLKLESGRAPVDVIVIDSVERPDPN